MIISVNWLKKFVDIDLPIIELTELIGARLVEIEEVINLGVKYRDVLIVRVVECTPLEGTDHLNLTKIDDGGVAKDVERDDKGLVQVVCGAPNVEAGMLVAWLPPGSTVPETYGDSEPFVLSTKNLRGTMSNGMLASAKELDLFDDHTGIIEIDKDIPVGSSFASVYELDDYLLDIENKSLTHRPDTFGIIGFAREVAAILGKDFVTPEWLANVDPTYGDKSGSIEILKVSIDDPELSERYQTVVLSGADGSRQSPLEIQTYLSRVGVRPINAVVDVTNYLMMLTGQPLHAFDYDKLLTVSGGKAEIHVRSGNKNEKLELLDGRTIALTDDDIVIAAGTTAVGLAGAMGGASTVIDSNTKNIIVESATFNLFKLRATQMRHGIFSEAITRFTKGQPAELTAPVLADAVELLKQWAGAKRVSDMSEATGLTVEPVILTLTTKQVNDVLGTTYNLDDIDSILKSVEFATLLVAPDKLSVAAPYWRSDIHIIEDVIEEIGRIKGFDYIVPTLPTRDFTAVSPNDFDNLRNDLRKLLVRAGANEVLTYSFVHGDMLQKSGQAVNNSYKIVNSISPDLQFYRQTLTPSLLSLVHPNSKQGYDSFALFELNKTHQKSNGLTEEQVPVEDEMLALTIAYRQPKATATYYDAKKYLEYIGDMLGVGFEYDTTPIDSEQSITAPFEYRRSAMVRLVATDIIIGIVGEYKSMVSRAFKLPSSSAGFEIDTRALFEAVAKVGSSYAPISRFPSTQRDVCFQVDNAIDYKKIIDSTNVVLADIELETKITPIDIYQADNADTKNVTIRIQLTSHAKTLNGQDVDEVMAKVIKRVVAQTNAIVI